MRRVLLCVALACVLPLKALGAEGPNVFAMFGDLYHPLKAGGTVALCRVGKWEQLSKSDDIIHRGRVTLVVGRVLYGERHEQLVLPATFATAPVLSDYADTWPKLADYPKDRVLLVAVLPGGVDPVAGEVGKTDGGATVIEEVVDGDTKVKAYEQAIGLHQALQKAKNGEERMKLLSPAVVEKVDVVRRYAVAFVTEELAKEDVPGATELLLKEVKGSPGFGKAGSREDFDAYLCLARMATTEGVKESERNAIVQGLVGVFLARKADEAGYSLAIQEIGNILRQRSVPAAGTILSAEEVAKLRAAAAEARGSKNDASARNAAEIVEGWLGGK